MPTVSIDCYVRDLEPYPGDPLVVAIDVIRATTSAVTAAVRGLRCVPVASLDEARELKRRRPDALLAGELAGEVPDGFDLNNSPPAIETLEPGPGPLVLLSSSGSRLMREAGALHDTVLVACLRNWSATADAAAGTRDVVLACAGTRGEFRDEDQLAAGWIGGALLDAGFTAAADDEEHIERWRERPVERAAEGRSGEFLRSSGQAHDLDFILEHVDDVPEPFVLEDGELASTALTRS